MLSGSVTFSSVMPRTVSLGLSWIPDPRGTRIPLVVLLKSVRSVTGITLCGDWKTRNTFAKCRSIEAALTQLGRNGSILTLRALISRRISLLARTLTDDAPIRFPSSRLIVPRGISNKRAHLQVPRRNTPTQQKLLLN